MGMARTRWPCSPSAPCPSSPRTGACSHAGSWRACPSSSAPPREPFGVVAVIPQPARLAAWSTRYAHGEVLVLDAAKGTLRSIGPLDTAPAGRLRARDLHPGPDDLHRPRCGWPRAGCSPSPRPSPPPASSRRACSSFTRTAGLPLSARPPPRPCAFRGSGPAARWETWTETDTPELITTAPQLFPAPEMVRVYALTGDDPTAHSPLWQSTLPPGRALHVVTADLDQRQPPRGAGGPVARRTAPVKSSSCARVRHDAPPRSRRASSCSAPRPRSRPAASPMAASCAWPTRAPSAELGDPTLADTPGGGHALRLPVAPRLPARRGRHAPASPSPASCRAPPPSRCA